jgi:hypothetical protein
MDRQWWDTYRAEVLTDFAGDRFSSNPVAGGVERVDIKPHGNSGAGAIALAARFGAKRIILVGYDCQHTGGKKHWHGDHPRNLGNAGSIERWPAKFAAMAKELPRDVEVINCSRETALDCFPRAALEDVM